MDDPTRSEAGERLLGALREGSITVPGLVVSATLEVQALGAGESYATWKVAGGCQAVVVRSPHCPPEEMPTWTKDEFDASALDDGSVGSRALAMDDSSDNALGAPFIVPTFVPDAVFAAAEWDEALLMVHARQMAKLHDPRYEGAGGLERMEPRSISCASSTKDTHGGRNRTQTSPTMTVSRGLVPRSGSGSFNHHWPRAPQRSLQRFS